MSGYFSGVKYATPSFSVLPTRNDNIEARFDGHKTAMESQMFFCNARLKFACSHNFGVDFAYKA